MSNAFDKASLVMLPHAYEEGKVYSLKPTDRSGDFTFSRGTDTATRVGEDGYIKKEYANLLEQSNNFADTSAWVQNNLTRTQGELGYDGSNDAWEIVRTATGSVAVTNTTTSTGVVTFSLHVKVNPQNGIGICFNGSAGDKAFFNISDTSQTSPVEIAGGVFAASINYIGNNWYRISASYNGSNSGVQIRCLLADGSAFTPGATYIVQDAMLNQGLVAYPYLETTTAPVYGGLTDNMPRLDYSGGATCPSLLLEPSRTNMLKSSEWIGGADQVNGATVSVDNTISPEGYSNVSKITSTINSSNIRYLSLQYTAGVTYTFSAWIKNIDATSIPFLWYDVNTQSTFDLINDVNTDSFTRVKYSFTATNTTSQGQFQIARDLLAGESFYIYGVQLEAGSYPTSYIPTYGSSQTRAAEDMDLNLSTAWDSTSSWTIFLELQRMIDDSISYYDILIFNGTQGSLYFRDRSTSLQVLILGGTDGISFAFTGTINRGDIYKIAVKWDGTDMKAFFNGEEITFSNPLSGSYGFNSISVNNSHIKHKELYFSTALSDSELAALTTL